MTDKKEHRAFVRKKIRESLAQHQRVFVFTFPHEAAKFFCARCGVDIRPYQLFYLPPWDDEKMLALPYGAVVFNVDFWREHRFQDIHSFERLKWLESARRIKQIYTSTDHFV